MVERRHRQAAKGQIARAAVKGGAAGRHHRRLGARQFGEIGLAENRKMPLFQK